MVAAIIIKHQLTVDFSNWHVSFARVTLSSRWTLEIVAADPYSAAVFYLDELLKRYGLIVTPQSFTTQSLSKES